MASQGSGSILNMASAAGLIGWPGASGYVAAKHGVVGLTKAAALEYAEAGVRVNSICPSYTLTPMVEKDLFEDTLGNDEELIAAAEEPPNQPLRASHRGNHSGQRSGCSPTRPRSSPGSRCRSTAATPRPDARYRRLMADRDSFEQLLTSCRRGRPKSSWSGTAPRRRRSRGSRTRWSAATQNPALAEAGKAGPSWSPEGLRHEPISAIFVSTLRRTAETAAPLAAATGLEPVAIGTLREVFLGDFEGGVYRIKTAEGDPTIKAVFETEAWSAIPNAETFEEFGPRITAGVEEMVRQVGQTGSGRGAARRRDRPALPAGDRQPRLRLRPRRQRLGLASGRQSRRPLVAPLVQRHLAYPEVLMPAFLVHGNPDSARLWSRTIANLGDYEGEIVAADLPGFAKAAPAGFPRTKEAYVDWISERLEALGGGVDLVGHDWGSLLVQRITSTRPTWSARSPAVAPRSTAPTRGTRSPRSGRPPARASATWRRS